MPIRIDKIKVYLGPQEQNAPDSLILPIIDFINNAKKRQNLMIAVQEIENLDIVKAIIQAKKRGVIIDVVIEQDYLLTDSIMDNPFDPIGKNETNRFLYNALLRSCIDIKCDFNTKIFHQKFMICGDNILTGSTNFTDTGIAKNLNHIVVIKDYRLAKEYKKEFKEIKQGRFGRYSIDRDEKPKELIVSEVRIKPLFAPDHAPEMEIMKQILKAKKRIDFAVFTFAQSSGIDDALISACERGVEVTGILDRRQSNQKWAATHPLKNAGVKLKIAGNSGGLGKLHHKLMVIDDSVTIFGSFNYTKPANRSNDENILIVGDLNETNYSSKNKQGKIAKACRLEIERIGLDFGSEI